MDRIPEISCSLYLTFLKNLDIGEINNNLIRSNIDILNYRREPKTDEHSLQILHVDYKHFWYLEEALSELFKSLDDNKINSLSKLLAKFDGTVLLDIAFCQYGTYPSLGFEGNNMRIIRELKADISIDAY